MHDAVANGGILRGKDLDAVRKAQRFVGAPTGAGDDAWRNADVGCFDQLRFAQGRAIARVDVGKSEAVDHDRVAILIDNAVLNECVAIAERQPREDAPVTLRKTVIHIGFEDDRVRENDAVRT